MNTLAKLTKKLANLSKKLVAFVRLNCHKLIRKVALEVTRLEGEIEKLQTAANPTAKEKYTWTLKSGYGICKNNENGNEYSVSWDCCSCPDWQNRRRWTGENCKHQLMYFDLASACQQKEEILIDENQCPSGTWLRRTDDWMSIEYQVWCYQEKYNPRFGFEIQQTCLGRVIQGNNEILAGTLRSMPRGFSSTENAINYLIRYNGIDAIKIADIYSKKHQPKAQAEPESETTITKKWLSIEDLMSNSLAI